MRKNILLLMPLALAGCHTWDPTWSELAGSSYSRPQDNRYAVIVTRIDDKPIFGSKPTKLEPGMYKLRVQSTMPGLTGSTFENMDLDVQACKRYILSAQYRDPNDPKFAPVVEQVEPLANCNVKVAQK